MNIEENSFQQNTYERIVNQNIKDFYDNIEHIYMGTEAGEHKCELDEEILKENYQNFFFIDDIQPPKRMRGHSWFLLYSGEKFENIKNLINCSQITPEIEKHIFIFLESFIEKCKNHSGEELRNISRRFYNSFLNRHPSIFSYLNNKDKFTILSQIITNDEIGHISQAFLGDFHYNIVFGDSIFFDSIISDIENVSDSQALHILNLLQKVITTQGGYGEEHLLENIKYLCKKINEKFDNQFFQYKTDSILQDLKHIIHHGFTPANNYSFTETHSVEFENTTQSPTIKISADYVGSLGKSGYINKLGQYKIENNHTKKEQNNSAYHFSQYLKEKFISPQDHTLTVNFSGARFIYSQLNNLYHKHIDENNQILKKICNDVLGTEKGNEIYTLFMYSKGEMKKRISQLNTYLEELRKNHNSPEFSEDFTTKYDELNIWINNFLSSYIYNQFEKILNGISINNLKNQTKNIKGMSYNDLLESTNLNIYQSINKRDFSHLMKEMHTEKMVSQIYADIGFDITNLSLYNQTHLLLFLWKKNTYTFSTFKKILANIQDENNKHHFLNTFLACSKNPEIGDKILELAEHPDSGKIFEAFGELINLQSEVDGEDISSVDFLKTLISRGEKLLLEALKDSKNSHTLEIDEKYSQELVKSGAFVKALIKNQQKGEVMSMDEFNEKCPDYEIVTHQGALFHGTSEIDLFDDNNFPYPEILNFQDIQNIINRSKIAFQSSQKQQEFIYKNIVETFKNPNARHIFLKNKSNTNTIGYCKMIGNYFGSLYIDPNFIGDFGIGDLIQKMAINEFGNNSFPISASAFLDGNILERHINRLGGLGKEICYTPNGEAYLNFEWNSNIKVHNKKEIKIFQNIEELSHLCEKYFQNNFVLTNIEYQENGGGSVVFQQKEKES